MSNSEPPRLSLVVPTLNEADGIQTFVRELLAATEPLGDVEILIMDDSSRDGTAELAQAALGERGRVVVRERDFGLSAAVVHGWNLARAPVLGVMDSDLSHPPALLGRLLAEVEGGADLAVGTRYMPGGGTPAWPLWRRVASRAASRLAQTLVEARDPLSGFFMLRRQVLDGASVDTQGWKICMEILASGRCHRLAEVPFQFVDRVQGVSKFGWRPALAFAAHVAHLHARRRRAP